MRNNFIVFPFFFLLLIVSCEKIDKVLLHEEVSADPVSTFEYLWSDFDRLYGGFIARNIDWDSLYRVYRPQVYKEMTDEELYRVATGLLGSLNDGHVALFPSNPNLEMFMSGNFEKLKYCSDFKLSVVRNNYLDESTDYSDYIMYGKLPENIGYMRFSSFGESLRYYRKAINKILDYLKDTQGMIVDIRLHGGGDDMVGKYIAGRFATDKRLFMSVRLRNGPEHDNFTDPLYVSVEPEEGLRYEKKVVLLTNRFTVSAAETFTWAMNVLDNVTQIGDTTGGEFSDARTRELPNGWGYSIAVGDWRDKDGKSWEGIGVVPDIVVKNDSTDVANGIDKALERAMEVVTE